MMHLQDQRCEELLSNVKIEQIATLRDLIVLSSNATIGGSMQVLADKQITSAPVWDEEKGHYIGFVDVLDLAVFVAYTYYENFQKHPHLYDPKELRLRFQAPIKEVINASKRDPFCGVSSNESVAYLLNNFMQTGIHRVPVVNERGIGIVSQSDIIRFLVQNLDAISLTANQTIEELGLDKKDVISVPNDATLIDAFTLIVNNSISGVAVVDFKTGAIVNNLSASDLKGLTEQSFFRLEAQVHQIFANQTKPKLPPVTCLPNTRLHDLLVQVEKTGVHRVYVVDDNNRPTSVITLTDLLSCFARKPPADL